MLRYIAKRTLMMIPVLLGISLIVFSIMELTPGDPVSLMLGEGASEQAVHELREQMGLNDNFFVKYVRYVKNAVMGDLGISYRNKVPVISEIVSRFPTTLNLTFWGVVLSVVIGIPVGIISAVKQYTIIDTLSLLAALILTRCLPFGWD